MSKKVNINYNETFATTHSRDYYRGASFRYSGNWIVGAHYFSDDYNVDFVVHDQVLLACAKSHMSSLENEPKDFIFDNNGNITGVVSEYWYFVLSGIRGETPGIKIEDNYWWTCSDITNPVWVNTGVKAKMELSDLSPEEIALLQEPGLQVVTQFVDNVITQSLGQSTEKLPSQKLVTDELQNRPTKAEMSAAFINAKQISDLTYQPIGDYATNTRANEIETALNEAVEDINDAINGANDRIDTNETNISSVTSDLADEILNRQSEDSTLLGKIQTEITNRQNGDDANTQAISAINAKIPSAASSSNQLADKDYVHSEISTSSATFRGTYDTLAELQEQEADNNDYGFVVSTDALGNTVYSRYKYNGTSWIWEYDINSTEFTQTQWDAINSGITDSLVTKLTNIAAGAQVNKIEHIQINGTEQTITNKTVNLPAYPTTLPASDVYAWAKAATKPSYNFSEINGTVADSQLPDTISSDITGNANTSTRNTEISRTDEFHYQPVPVKHFNDAYKIDKIYGKTLAYCQLANATTTNNCTRVNDTTISYNVTNLTTGTYEYVATFKTVSGHKYYVKAVLLNGTNIFRLASYGDISYGTLPISRIITGTGAQSGIVLTVDTTSTGSGKIRFYCIDMTLLGIADLTTASAVEEWLKNNFDMVLPYSSGTLISNDASALETVGFNQWDEEWEVGGMNADGTPSGSITNRIRSKNFSSIIGGQTYYIKVPNSDGVTFYWYDSEKNFVSLSAIYTAGGSATAPSNAAYFKINLQPNYGTTYNNDICINLSDATRNGQYEPYRKSTLHLGLNNLKVNSHNIWDEEWEVGAISVESGNNVALSTRIRSKNYIPVFGGTKYFFKAPQLINVIQYDINKNFISPFISFRNEEKTLAANCAFVRFATANDIYGTTYNNDICINVSSSFNGQYEPHGILTINGVKSAGLVYDEIRGGKYIKRIGKVNFEDLTWTASTASYVAGISDKKYGYTNLLTPRFVTVTSNAGSSVGVGMISGGGASANIFLNFAEAASATALVAAHTGEPIYYELATPIEYELVEPMLNSGWIDENGTMRVVYEDESEPHVLFKSDITYGVNTGDALHSLNSKIDAYQTDTENKFNLYETIDSVKSKGNASTPVYFDASGTAQPITSYSGNAATATEIDTEVKTGQKFVYRQAVNTKKVNTLGIDKIAGKTLVWNQLMPNGNFVDTPDGWGAYSGAQKSIADGVCTLLATQAGSSIRRAVPSISGHKYYIATSIKTTSNLVGINIAGSIGTKATGTNSWERVANIWTSPTDNPSLYIGVGDNRTADWDNVLFTNFVFIDLTKMFGAGNEPSTVAEFKSMFPNSYYPYSPGSLISNDASALETVGFNQWDEKWELGDIGANTGQNVPYNGCIRSTNYNPCFSNTEYYITSAGKQGRLFWYDANKNFISAFQFGDNRLATSPSNACYFRFAMFNAYGTTYGNDICINLSDASRNGQYEPYWKRTLPLNLNSFKVKSPNIWDEQTEEGTIDSDGDPVASSGTLRTVHYIPVTPGKEYYIKLPLITELVVNPFFYDANKVFVKQLGSGIINETFVVPEGCWYMKIAFPIEYGSTYGNNVCINESGWANGRYFSHEDITITGGLKGAESVYDEIVGNKYVKRVGGSVDLGSLTYTKGEAGEHYRFGASVTGIKRAVNASTKGNIICAAFENIDPYASYIGIYGIAVAHNEDKVFISGSAYDSMTEEQVKAAFNGIYLVFELATLEEYELVSPIPSSVTAGTTEMRVSPNSYSLSTPMYCDMTYYNSLGHDVDFMNSLYEYIKRLEERIKILESS